MFRKSFTIIAAAATLALATSVGTLAQTEEPDTAAVETGYADVNGVNMYYEVHGSGEPLVLLHGGLGTIDMLFAQLLPVLSANRQVIAVELQGHGHTADIDRPLSYEAMADDVAALIEHLGYENADVMGFSLGGGVALQTAIRHPEAVDKLVLVSTVYQRNGWYPEVLAGMSSMNADAAAMMVETPLYQFYASVAPNPDDWTQLVVKSSELLAQDYDWSADVSALTVPTLIIVGDADSVRTSHAVELFGLLGGGQHDGASMGRPVSQLAIIPDTNHFTILSRTDLLLPVVNLFLDAPVPEAS